MANEITIMNENLEKNLELKIMDGFYVLTFKDFNDDYKMYLCYINQDDDLIIYDDGFRTKIAKLIRNIDIDAEQSLFDALSVLLCGHANQGTASAKYGTHLGIDKRGS